jgi:hypothetical protein
MDDSLLWLEVSRCSALGLKKRLFPIGWVSFFLLIVGATMLEDID